MRRMLLAGVLLVAAAGQAQTPQPGPVQVQLTPPSASLGQNNSTQFNASRGFIGGSGKPGASKNINACVKWTSSDQNIVSVDNTGLATGMNLGTAMITANCGPFHGSALVTVHGAQCGNGIREAGEQCDDGNNTNLDGCSATCTFEQDQRMNSITMKFNTDATCSKNALGGAIGSLAQSPLQTLISNGVGLGSINSLFAMLGISDLSGTTQPSFQIGVLGGTAVAGSGYNGASDLDWWYTPDPSSINVNRVPVNQLSASIAASALSAGPGSLTFPPVFGGAGELQFSNTMIKATVGASSTPLASSGTPPGHVAAENLDPALTSYGSMTGGSVCGGVSAASLAATPVPAALAQGGATACTQGYSTINNSLLDVFVGGCTVFVISAIAPTQPDTVDPNAPAAGAGGPYVLAENASHQVSSCKDKSGTPVSLSACLNAAAYSSYFAFTTDRVIIK